jgi:sulfatase modifying factor 1
VACIAPTLKLTAGIMRSPNSSPMAVALGLLILWAPIAGAEEYKDCAQCPSMVDIAAGSLMMGASPTELKTWDRVESVQREQPQHRVTIAHPFAIGRYPVTRQEFAAFASETAYDAKGCWVNVSEKWKLGQSNSWRDPGYKQTERDPAVCIGLEDAHQYAQWLSRKTGHSYRLPSEAEWEYAARAGTTASRFWGEDASHACDFANVADLTGAEAMHWSKADDVVFQCRDGYVQTAPVGSFKPNSFGLFDMLGNVWQWTEDCFHQDYGGAPSDGSAWAEPGCKYGVLRGGSWRGNPSNVRAAFRRGFDSHIRDEISGFRVVRTQ